MAPNMPLSWNKLPDVRGVKEIPQTKAELEAFLSEYCPGLFDFEFDPLTDEEAAEFAAIWKEFE